MVERLGSLREIAAVRGISLLNSAGNPLNTRQLGAAIIVSTNSANRFAWNDDDVVMYDEDGNKIVSLR